MLRLRTMYGLINLNKYLEFFEHQGEKDLSIEYGKHLSNKKLDQPLEEISLYWDNVPSSYQLQLVIAPDRMNQPCFMVKYWVEGQLLETNKLLPARESNLAFIKKTWMKAVQLFAYAGVSSSLSVETFTPNQVEERFMELANETPVQEDGDLLKNQLRIKIGGELFHFSALEPQSNPLQDIRLNHLIYSWYDRFLMHFREGTLVKLADSEETFIMEVPGAEMVITLDEESLELPISFSMALQGEHPTEMNDGECSAIWLWGIRFKEEAIYLPIGHRMELGYSTEKGFISAVSEMIEGINACMGLMELLALEARSGAKLSSNFVQKEYESIISRYPFMLIDESGKVWQAPQMPVVPTPSRFMQGVPIAQPQQPTQYGNAPGYPIAQPLNQQSAF